MASKELQSIQEKMRQELAGLRNAVAPPSSNKISLNGKVFSFPNGESSQGPISFVILDFRNVNIYYDTAYSAKDPKPPKCFAIAKELPGIAPSEKVEEPQSDTCATCQWNKWKSSPTGDGKACRNTVRLAIVAPDADANAEPMTLQVSPTGLKSWNALVNRLESAGMLPIQMVVEAKFDENKAYPSLQFKELRPHDQLEKFWALREQAQGMLDATPSQGG